MTHKPRAGYEHEPSKAHLGSVDDDPNQRFPELVDFYEAATVETAYHYLKKENPRLNATVRGLFSNLADNGVFVNREIRDYFNSEYMWQVQGGDHAQPLTVHHNIMSPSGESNMLVVLNVDSINVLSNTLARHMELFDYHEDQRELSEIAMDAYYCTGAAMAVYEHLIYGKWCSNNAQFGERNFKAHMRAARKIVQELIGAQDIPSDPDQLHPYQLFGGWVFDELLIQNMINSHFDGPGLDVIIRNRAKLGALAYKLTEDRFFLGLVAPVGQELRDAYIKAATKQGTLRAVD